MFRAWKKNCFCFNFTYIGELAWSELFAINCEEISKGNLGGMRPLISNELFQGFY